MSQSTEPNTFQSDLRNDAHAEREWIKIVQSNHCLYGVDKELAVQEYLDGLDWAPQSSVLLRRIKEGKRPLKYPPPGGRYDLIESDSPVELPHLYPLGVLLIIGHSGLHIMRKLDDGSYLCTAPGWKEEAVAWHCYIDDHDKYIAERVSGQTSEQLLKAW